MKSILKKVLLGIHHQREYICASAGEISGGLDCYAFVNGKQIPVEGELLFLGYRPLVMGLIAAKFDGKMLAVEFRRKDNAQTIATLELQLEQEFAWGEKTIFLFKAISSKQNFESSFHRFMFNWYERFRSKQPGNIDLDPENYNQVKIAYSIPREIKLVTLGNGNSWNVFPTDLHGRVGNSAYLISLRHDKKACKQVMETGKLALWTISASFAAQTYALGKNHSADMKPAEKHYFTANKSPLLHFPEPAGALACEEFDLAAPIADIGIHRIFLLQSKTGAGNVDPKRLVHLHRSYVQWHIQNGFPFTESPR